MAVVKRLEENFSDLSPRRELVYEDTNARVMRFYLKEGQEIKPHRSSSSVFITVLRGNLLFITGEGEETLGEGDTVFYKPEELHGFKALKDSVVEATISPNPATKKVS